MNQTKITAFGGAVHDDSELQDGNETMSIEEFLNTVLGRLLQIQIIIFFLGGGGSSIRDRDISWSANIYSSKSIRQRPFSLPANTPHTKLNHTTKRNWVFVTN